MLRIALIFFVLLSTGCLWANEDSLRQILNNYKKEDTIKIGYYTALGNAILRKNPPLAREEYFLGLHLAEKIGFAEGQFELNKNIGTTHYYMGDLDSTYFYWRLAMESVSYADLKRKGDGFNNMGVYFQRVGNLDSALYYYNESLRLKSMEKDSLRIASSLANLGALYRQRGSYSLALEHYYKALDLYGAAGEKKQEADVLNGIGLLHINLSDYETALEYLEKSMEIRKELGDRRSILSSLINIAGVYKDMELYIKAKEINEQCIPLCVELKDQKNLAGVYMNMGNIYRRLENFDESFKYYQEALTLFELAGDQLNVGLTQNNLGFLEIDRNHPEKGITYFNDALDYTETQQSLDYKRKIYNGLALGYEAQKDYANALAAQKRFREIDDSLFTDELEDRVGFYQEKYQAKEKENKILLLEQEALISDEEVARNKRARNIAILIAALILSTLLMMFYFLRLRKRLYEQKELIHLKEKERLEAERERKEIELDGKNRELTSFATYVVQKNELLERLKESIQNIKSGNLDPQNLRNVESLISEGVHVDKDWNTFKVHFENVHPHFFHALLSEFPKLSSNDLRMCAYMKMNLSTKEMAALMNITAKSVRMNRYRLKKKMELPEEEEVMQFLQHFQYSTQPVSV